MAACTVSPKVSQRRGIRHADAKRRRRRSRARRAAFGNMRRLGIVAAAVPNTSQASATVMAKIEIVSSVRQAGTTPVADNAPSVGFSPTMPFSAAGTRPEPAVSVPSANAAMPRATATAEPEEEPPGTIAGSSALRGTGYGVRTPTRPVANWSRLVLPRQIAPASRSLQRRRRRLSAARRSPGRRRSSACRQRRYCP